MPYVIPLDPFPEIWDSVRYQPEHDGGVLLPTPTLDELDHRETGLFKDLNGDGLYEYLVPGTA